MVPPKGPAARWSGWTVPLAQVPFPPRIRGGVLRRGGGVEIFPPRNRFIGTPISDKLGWYRFRKSKEVGGYMKVRSCNVVKYVKSYVSKGRLRCPGYDFIMLLC